MLKPWCGCYALHCFISYIKVGNIRRYFTLRGLLLCPDFPCLKGRQVTLKRPESRKQHNNKFTFNFWPYSWRFLVVSERNALVPPFLKAAENSFFKCLKEKTSSFSFPQIGGSMREINPKSRATGHLPASLLVNLLQSSCPVPDLSIHWFHWVDCLLGGFVLI